MMVIRKIPSFAKKVNLETKDIITIDWNDCHWSKFFDWYFTGFHDSLFLVSWYFSVFHDILLPVSGYFTPGFIIFLRLSWYFSTSQIHRHRTTGRMFPRQLRTENYCTRIQEQTARFRPWGLQARNQIASATRNILFTPARAALEMYALPFKLWHSWWWL